MSGTALAFDGVTVRYEAAARPAVDDVSLAVAVGSFVVFLGPSGCGKSTLLRTVNRLIVPSGGRVLMDGRDVGSLAPTELRRGIGYAIQAVGLFPHYTVAQNVAIVPELLRWDRARIRARVDELLALVRLDPARFRDRLPRELSGGEQQRVGVARAIAAGPPLLLMDEPFGAVDPVVRRALQDEMRRIHADLGATILFVTHDVDEALALADVLVVMRAGRIEQVGAPLALLGAPATPYVAELLDARDALRRLSLMRAGDAVSPREPDAAGAQAQAPAIAADASLREALAALLACPGGAEPSLVVRDGEAAVGILRFAEIRAAVAGRRNRCGDAA